MHARLCLLLESINRKGSLPTMFFGCNVCSSSDLSACSSCAPGYYPQADSSGVNRCVTYFSNCKVCTSATKCTKCVAGYIPSADGSTCTLKCSENCLTCDQTNSTQCLTCYAAFYRFLFIFKHLTFFYLNVINTLFVIIDIF